MSPRHFGAPAPAGIPWLVAGLLACAGEPLAPLPDLRPGILGRPHPLFNPDFFRKDGLRLARQADRHHLGHRHPGLRRPANTGFGYFTVSLVNLPRPAKRFSFDHVFVRSSVPTNTFIPYGISEISYVHMGRAR